jgi:tetratricopeptide (TPR) repeat protein
MHLSRLSPDTLQWLKSNISPELSFSDWIHELLNIISDMISKNLPIDAEVAYLAVKGGVMTGKLHQVVSFDSTDPAIRGYQGLAWLFMNKFSKAEEFLSYSRKKADQLKDPAIIGEIMGMYIYLANARYQFFLGVQILQQALPLILKKENLPLADFFQWLRIAGAKSLMKLGNIQEAIYVNKRALEIAKKSNDHFFHAFALLGLGHCLDMVGKTSEAIKNYEKALVSARKINALNILSIIYNRLGMSWAWRLDNFNRGLDFFQQAVLNADIGESFWLREGPQWNLAALYRSKKEFNKAIQSIQDIIDSAQKAGESRTELIAYLNLIEILESKGDSKEAKRVREAAESLAQLIGMDLSEINFEEEDLENEDDVEELDFDDVDKLNNIETNLDEDNSGINYLEEYDKHVKDLKNDDDFEESLRRFFRQNPE